MEEEQIRRAAAQAARHFRRNPGSASVRASSRYRTGALRMAQVDAIIRAVIDETGVPVPARLWYLNFGRAVARLQRRFAARTLARELCLLKLRWQHRGLDPALLEKLTAQLLCVLDDSGLSTGETQPSRSGRAMATSDCRDWKKMGPVRVERTTG